MTLFPVTRPRLGLAISEQALCLVEIQRGWRGRSFHRATSRRLSSGLIHISPNKPNISDKEAFANILQSIRKGRKHPQPIALSLPDLCARTAVLEFSSLPKTQTEREVLVKWRFQQDFHIPTSNARVAFQVYGPSKGKIAASNGAQPVFSVLATLIQQDILAPYERLCLQVGLLPVSVGLTALNIFELYRSQIHRLAQTAANRSHAPVQELVFLFLTHWGFSFLAFREGRPVFIRVKALHLAPPPSVSDAPEASPLERADNTHDARIEGSHNPSQEPLDTEKEIIPDVLQEEPSPLMILRVGNEIMATIHYYLESIQPIDRDRQELTLFVIEDLDHPQSLLLSQERLESLVKTSPQALPTFNIVTFQDWGNTFSQREGVPSLPSSLNVLPAYAGVMVAS